MKDLTDYQVEDDPDTDRKEWMAAYGSCKWMEIA